jgi:hypothetical protein
MLSMDNIAKGLKHNSAFLWVFGIAIAAFYFVATEVLFLQGLR